VWLKTWFGDRAALGLALHLGPHDALLPGRAAQRVSDLTGVPMVPRWVMCACTPVRASRCWMC
jgi:hypothetical protein